MNEKFQEEVLNLLRPKIKSVLKQTDKQNQEDLEQELILLVLTAIKEKSFNRTPSFFELIEKENIDNY